MAYRVDLSRIKQDKRTPQGGAKIPAALTRTGVFVYTESDGSIRRELRHPDEVFHGDAMATLDTAVVTVGHPGRITAENYRALGVGHVRNQRRDGSFVAADLVVQDKTAVDRIDTGDLQEISCGYDCDIDLTPGSYQGERYDAVQRSIRYNHVGLGPKDWGRAGNEVRLRLDGGDNGHIAVAYTAVMGDTDKDLQARLDALTTDFAGARADRDKLQGRCDAAESQSKKLLEEVAQLKRDLAGASSLERIDGIIRTRTLVLDGARLLHGRVEIDTAMPERELMVAALKIAEPRFDSVDRSDDYIRARFDAAVGYATNAGASLAKLRSDSTNTSHDDASDPLVQAQINFDKNNESAWKRNLMKAEG